MSYKVVEFKNDSNPENTWSTIVKNSNLLWYFSNFNYNYFHAEYTREKELLIEDKSFFIYDGITPLALTVLIFSKDHETGLLQGSYLSEPLPWPIISDDCTDRDQVYEIIFDEIDKRVKSFSISKINFVLNTNEYCEEIENEFYSILIRNNMIDKSFYSHLLEVNRDTLKNVRKSYLKNIKKKLKEYSVKIIKKNEYYESLALEYKNLHNEDVGKETRSIRTYEIQLEAIKKDEAFAVQVISNNNKLVGMLIIYYENNSAYDGSVAVIPEFKELYVSHILKYHAILELINLKIKNYELGKAAISPSYNWIPSNKNYGISFFKKGWSNNKYKKVYLAEKIYSYAALKLISNKYNNILKKFFHI